MLPFVHAEAINIKHGDLDARKMLDLFSYGWLPLPKSILHRGEFGDLPLPTDHTYQNMLSRSGEGGSSLKPLTIQNHLAACQKPQYRRILWIHAGQTRLSCIEGKVRTVKIGVSATNKVLCPIASDLFAD